ncbi:BrnA antitoxin family protein [Chelatococcus sp. GCM10030263]|uniref:BrnA antitoxin family protein n=1 Tax=Chelatococcus sp. GCM10030263 TaxID=3273387 RepID=UPI003615802B
MTKRHPRLDISDEEEACIQRQIASDPNAPEATEEQLAQARPFAEVFPELAASIRRTRGRPRVEAPKEAVTLRLDPRTIAKFRAAGEDWRAKMAAILEKAKV